MSGRCVAVGCNVDHNTSKAKYQGSECLFAGCSREAVSVHLCRAHNNQWLRGRTLTPIRPLKKAYKDELGRVCTDCDEYKEYSEFYGNKSRCKPCFIVRQLEYNRARVQ